MSSRPYFSPYFDHHFNPYLYFPTFFPYIITILFKSLHTHEMTVYELFGSAATVIGGLCSSSHYRYRFLLL